MLLKVKNKIYFYFSTSFQKFSRLRVEALYVVQRQQKGNNQHIPFAKMMSHKENGGYF